MEESWDLSWERLVYEEATKGAFAKITSKEETHDVFTQMAFEVVVGVSSPWKITCYA